MQQKLIRASIKLRTAGKTLVLLALIPALLAQAFSKVVILARFKIQQEYIAKTLCERKAEKGNCCKGSCHLRKELKAEESAQSKYPNFLKDKFQPVFQVAIRQWELHLPSTQNILPRTLQRALADPGSGDIFHPPTLG